MTYRGRWGATLLLIVLVVAAVMTSSSSTPASASVRRISKPTYIDKADAICKAASAKLEKAAAKLGSKPTDKQVKAFLLAVYVPNIAGQIAKIRALGYPSADKAQLTALYRQADQVLAKIKRNPTAAINASASPFADVATKQQAYGFTACGASPSSSGDAAATAQAVAGHYQGAWTNNTSATSGTVDLTISLDPAETIVTIDSTLTGNVLGDAPPPAQSIAIPLAALSGAKPVAVALAPFGRMTITAKSDGSLVADAPAVPSNTVSKFHLVLVPRGTTMNGTYSVGLTTGATANGTVTLTKV